MPRFAANLGCAPLEPMKAAADDAEPAIEVDRLAAHSSEVCYNGLKEKVENWGGGGKNPLEAR